MADFGGLFNSGTMLPGTQSVLNDQKAQLNNITINKAPLALDLIRSQIANYSAETNLHQADAGLKQEQLKQAQIASQKMQEYAANQKAAQEKAKADPLNPASATDFSDRLDGLASLKEQARTTADMGFFISSGGAPAAGKAYIDQGVGTLSKISTIERNTATQRAAALLASEREVNMTAQYLGGAKSPAEFEAGKSALMAAFPDMPANERQQLLSQQYSPGVVQHINDQAIAAKDKVRLAIEAAKQKSLEAAREDTKNDREIRRSTAYAEQQAEAREKAKAKFTGTKAAQPPKPEEITGAQGAIRRLIYPGLGKTGLSTEQQDQVETAAVDVIAEKKRLLAGNRALTDEEAQSRAAAAVSKNFKPVDAGRSLRHPFTGSSKDKYMDGSTAATAQDLPANKADAKEGKHYLVGGKPHTWNGTVFVPDAVTQ